MKPSLKRLSLMVFIAAALSIPFWRTAVVLAMSDDAKKKIVMDMYDGYKTKFRTVVDMSPSMAAELMKSDKVVFVDVRREEEMHVSMLPGAISKREFLNRQDRFDDRVIVAYCTIGYRSGMFAKKMDEAEDRRYRIANLAGGLLAWVLDGGKVYDEKGASRRIHVYGKRWNYPPEGYDSVW